MSEKLIDLICQTIAGVQNRLTARIDTHDARLAALEAKAGIVAPSAAPAAQSADDVSRHLAECLRSALK